MCLWRGFPRQTRGHWELHPCGKRTWSLSFPASLAEAGGNEPVPGPRGPVLGHSQPSRKRSLCRGDYVSDRAMAQEQTGLLCCPLCPFFPTSSLLPPMFNPHRLKDAPSDSTLCTAMNGRALSVVLLWDPVIVHVAGGKLGRLEASFIQLRGCLEGSVCFLGCVLTASVLQPG